MTGPGSVGFSEGPLFLDAKGPKRRAHLGDKVLCGSDRGSEEFVVQGWSRKRDRPSFLQISFLEVLFEIK